MSDLEKKLIEIAHQYPSDLVESQISDVRRIAFHLTTLLNSGIETNGTVADLGGGIGLFSVGAAALGMKSILVDDFSDAVNWRHPVSTLQPHQRYGVEVISADVTKGIDLAPSSLDAVTSFDSMEHWHHSPKALFASVLKALKPGGTFLLGVPNAVNLRKRLTVPFGRGAWSSMQEWYEPPVFRGHVREPSVGDLLYIGRDLGLEKPRVFGRNWLGYQSPSALVRKLTPFVDKPLQLAPSLCADIYLLGFKPRALAE
ncbi:MAG: class I SAM-dependent methyltransferase [Methyloceanibacter sp.]